MNLDIKLIQEKILKRYRMPTMVGCLFINDFWESFMCSLDVWTREDYLEQWAEGLERIKTKDTSCLVTSFQDPKLAPLLVLWPLYRIGSKIYIRNYMYVGEHFIKLVGKKEFTKRNCYDFVEKRKIYKKLKVSEWCVDISEL